jgi:hypothetical protein
MNLVANFVGFQVGWFACVLGAANHMPVMGSLIAAVIVTYHLYRYSFALNECYLILAAVVVGFIWETIVISHDLLIYPLSEAAIVAPVWLVMMWALFATTINVSMAWLKRRWILAVIMGAIFGPMAFIGGEKLGAVVFVDSKMALLVLSLGWAILMPLILWIADFINGLDPVGETIK